jgi:lysophospholipase L1-like esterase
MKYIRGKFAARYGREPINLLCLGDSIMQVYQSWSVLGTCVLRWPAVCLGARTGSMNSAGSGWPLSVSQYGGGGNGIPITLRPGDVAPDGSSGFNVMQTQVGQFDVNGTDFGSPQQVVVNPNNSNNPGWDTNRNVIGIMTGRTEPVAANPDIWRLQAWDRANTFLGDLVPGVDFDQPAADRVWTTPTFARGSGVFNIPLRLSTFNENEAGALVKTCTFGMKVVGVGQGIFFGYAGHGSWGVENHSREAGRLITADGTPYTGRYTDSALVADYLAYRWNVVMIMLGANDAALSKAQWKSEMAILLQRHRNAAAAAGMPSPDFVGVSTYDLSDNNVLQVEKAEAWNELAREHADVEFCDARGAVERQLGKYSDWQPTQATDGVHPSGATLRNVIADSVWNDLFSTPDAVQTSRLSRGRTYGRGDEWMRME